jgi:hypothetical protein
MDSNEEDEMPNDGQMIQSAERTLARRVAKSAVIAFAVVAFGAAAFSGTLAHGGDDWDDDDIFASGGSGGSGGSGFDDDLWDD